MPNWSNPLEVLKEVEIFNKLGIVMLGLYTWEIIIQLPFDWSVISRRRQVHWPSFFYFYCKYSLWLCLLCNVVILNVTTEVNCQAFYMFDQFSGYTTIGSASTLLMLRTIAVWNRNPFVTVPLVIASLGQWGILCHGIASIRGSWNYALNMCVIDSASPAPLELIYVYTMSFDFLVLVLTTVGLVISPTRSSLWHLIFRQGVIFFLVAFIANMIPTVFLVLKLNEMMNVMFTISAAVASSIVACRSFVSLTNFRQNGLYVYSPMPRPAAGIRRSRSDDVTQVCARDDGSNAKKKGLGNTIAGITLRIGAGIDSMGQVCTISEVNMAARPISALAATSKPRCDFRGASEKGEAAVHVETTDVQSGDHAIVVGWEKGESLSHGYRQKVFASDV